MSPFQKNELIQGTPEWLALRKTKITATDAPIILGVSHWKTRLQLYNEKISDDVNPLYITERMQRGLDLEPIARDLFYLKTAHKMEPKVIIKDWAMASLDGINDRNEILEIKCPGEKDHQLALQGKIPEHYYPQLQHQMYVADSEKVFYFSFDGFDGVIIEVSRDNDYIAKMIVEEKKFYDCLINRTPPELTESDYILRDDELWQQYAVRWKNVYSNIKKLEKEEEELRKQLISLSGETNCKGFGVSICLVQRKGNIDYSAIEELKKLDLEKYRKDSIRSWRITCQ